MCGCLQFDVCVCWVCIIVFAEMPRTSIFHFRSLGTLTAPSRSTPSAPPAIHSSLLRLLGAEKRLRLMISPPQVPCVRDMRAFSTHARPCNSKRLCTRRLHNDKQTFNSLTQVCMEYPASHWCSTITSFGHISQQTRGVATG
jgi:hypothetical protein